MADVTYSYFIRPDIGYVETLTPVSLSRMPEGTIAIATQRPADGWDWVDGEWIDNRDPADLLAAERAGMVCSRFQAKAALLAAGLLPTIEALVANSEPFVQLAWAEAVEFRRTSPTILALQSATELTDEQIDDLFRVAMGIEA